MWTKNIPGFGYKEYKTSRTLRKDQDSEERIKSIYLRSI